VTHVCETVWNAIEKVKDAAVADLSLLDELGLTEIERELAQIDPGYHAVSPTARLDSFLTEDRLQFRRVEWRESAALPMPTPPSRYLRRFR